MDFKKYKERKRRKIGETIKKIAAAGNKFMKCEAYGRILTVS